jgi:hypothetical protein
MSKTGSRVIGVISIVLAVGSAVLGGYYFALSRTKHGLLFAAIFVVLLVFGLLQMRNKTKTVEQSPAK